MKEGAGIYSEGSGIAMTYEGIGLAVSTENIIDGIGGAI